MPRHAGRRNRPRGGPWFELASAHDLFAKLKHDLKRIESDVRDSYAAFDFFVTAHHLVDWWEPPGTRQQAKAAKAAVQKSVLGTLCREIADGQKHFSGPSQTGMHHGAFSADFSPEFDVSHLVVRPTAADAVQTLGPEIYLLDLARRVVSEWDARLGSGSGLVAHQTPESRTGVAGDVGG